MTHTRSCNATALLLCCAAATQLSNVEARAPRLRPIGGWRQAEVAPGRPSTVNCTWANFSQKIDHFGPKLSIVAHYGKTAMNNK